MKKGKSKIPHSRRQAWGVALGATSFQGSVSHAPPFKGEDQQLKKTNTTTTVITITTSINIIISGGSYAHALHNLFRAGLGI